MYAYIKGELIDASPIRVIVDAGGVGYQIFIPANVFSKLPQTGNQILLHTSYIVRELSQSLYGFLARQECELFEILMNVTGIGPKLALSIIGHLSILDLQTAILNNQLTTICKVPGIGKKTAERLVIELRDKLNHLIPEAPRSMQMPIDSNAQKVRDAMSALINLGYNQSTAQKAIKKTMEELNDECELGLLITSSLKNI